VTPQNSQDLNFNTNIYLKETGWKDADWGQLAKDRDRWSALINKVMGLRFAQNPRSYLTT